MANTTGVGPAVVEPRAGTVRTSTGVMGAASHSSDVLARAGIPEEVREAAKAGR